MSNAGGSGNSGGSGGHSNGNNGGRDGCKHPAGRNKKSKKSKGKGKQRATLADGDNDTDSDIGTLLDIALSAGGALERIKDRDGVRQTLLAGAEGKSVILHRSIASD